MSALAYNEFVWNWLDSTYGMLKHAEKRLARDAKTTPNTAANWLKRLNAPNGENLSQLLATNRELRARLIQFAEQLEKERGEYRE